MARKLRQVRLAVHVPLKFRCHEDWQAMTRVAGGRACAACDHVVHDLSAMTEREAARFMTEKGGTGVCLRYAAHADGTIVYRRSEPSRVAPTLMAAALAACTPHEPLPRISAEPEAALQDVPVSNVVVVPPAPVAPPPAPPVAPPPDDDINPCPGPAYAQPGAAKTSPKPKPKPGKAVPREPIEYVGFEG